MHFTITADTTHRITSRDLNAAALQVLADGGRVELYLHPAHESLRGAVLVETVVYNGERAGQSYGGDAVWGDWDEESRTFRLEERGAEGEVLVAGLDGLQRPESVRQRKLHVGYVRLTDGEPGAYALQLPSQDASGFELCRAMGEDSQSWPGGHGLATEWVAVKRADVPKKVRAAMDWLLESSGYAVCDGCGEAYPDAEGRDDAQGSRVCQACQSQSEREDAAVRAGALFPG